ncbi:rhomboid family intramembrane serine protease [Methylobacterium oryzihabitans]|uniref:Rhomboid family intramembrane serine protease n=1 Tax=Methylobacterium oryzihabitans TaxID=2499852 RepID=A0A3S2VFN6_9HYPH|nr:rhomboid family intramembrane serine protease [Methylobacterium oryzihabitans]RVU21956.1 rhomboid family intramembrane serine protease [Methylobacterium oryzihabitans]
MDATPDLPRPPHVPVFNMPTVVTASVGLLVLIHAVRALVLPDLWDVTLLVHLALIPARITAFLAPDSAGDILREAASAGTQLEIEARSAFANYILADSQPMPWTLASYALLHGSWTHVLLNSVWLAAFGTPVARRCGPWRYGLIGLAATVAGAAVHVAIDPYSTMPLVGASAGVSGLMAAATRFVFQPPADPGFAAGLLPWQRPAPARLQTIPELMRNRPAMLFLVIWLATNLLFGLAAVPLGMSDASIAWDAHLGGFVAGFFLLPLLDGRRRH